MGACAHTVMARVTCVRNRSTVAVLQSIAGIEKTETWVEGPFLRVSYAAKRPEGYLFLKGQTTNSVAVFRRFGPQNTLRHVRDRR